MMPEEPPPPSSSELPPNSVEAPPNSWKVALSPADEPPPTSWEAARAGLTDSKARKPGFPSAEEAPRRIEHPTPEEVLQAASESPPSSSEPPLSPEEALLRFGESPPSSWEVAPPSSGETPPISGEPLDVEAIQVALVLAPATYPRNRFWWLFRDPELRKARWRAAQLRGLVRALTGPGVVVESQVDLPTGGRVLSYRQESINLRGKVTLQAHEAAVIDVAVARIQGKPVPGEAMAAVQQLLARLAPAARADLSTASPQK